MEFNHKSLIANKVPLTHTLLNPLTYTLGKLAYTTYRTLTLPSVLTLTWNIIALFSSPTLNKLFILS